MIAKRRRRMIPGRRQEFSYSPMIWVRDADGRHQLWGGAFKTKTEAKATERRLLQERDAGADLKPSTLTIMQVCEQYIAEKATK